MSFSRRLERLIGNPQLPGRDPSRAEVPSVTPAGSAGGGHRRSCGAAPGRWR